MLARYSMTEIPCYMSLMNRISFRFSETWFLWNLSLFDVSHSLYTSIFHIFCQSKPCFASSSLAVNFIRPAACRFQILCSLNLHNSRNRETWERERCGNKVFGYSGTFVDVGKYCQLFIKPLYSKNCWFLNMAWKIWELGNTVLFEGFCLYTGQDQNLYKQYLPLMWGKLDK